MHQDLLESKRIVEDWLVIYEKLEQELDEQIKKGVSLTISLQNALLSCLKQVRSARIMLQMIDHHLIDIDAFQDYDPLTEVNSLFQEPY